MFKLKRAKELKKEQGRETKWLADQCAVEHKTMSMYFQGAINPSQRVVKLMALALNVPESELWTEEAEQKAS